MERAGRRLLLLVPFFFMAVFHACLTVSLNLQVCTSNWVPFLIGHLGTSHNAPWLWHHERKACVISKWLQNPMQLSWRPLTLAQYHDALWDMCKRSRLYPILGYFNYLLSTSVRNFGCLFTWDNRNLHWTTENNALVVCRQPKLNSRVTFSAC